MWGPVNREKQRLNQTRPLPSKKPLISEGRDVLTKASTGQNATGLPMYPPSEKRWPTELGDEGLCPGFQHG